MLGYIKEKIHNQIIRLHDYRDAFLYNRYKRKALIPFNKNWFEGKRVAIIGGADSAYKHKLGDYIDSFDVVVRINNGVRVIDKYKEFIGTRTDYLFHTLYENIEGGGSPIEIELWKRKNVGRVFFTHNENVSEYGYLIKNFVLSNKGTIAITQADTTLAVENLNLIHPFHPTSGLIAINIITQSKPLSLYITGITFFRTPHHQEYRKGDVNHWINKMKSDDSKHNPDAEYEFFKDLYRSNSEIFILDKTLKDIIDNDYE